MNAGERREIGVVIAMLHAGDRSGAIGKLRTLRTPSHTTPLRGPQLVLAFVAAEPFRCDRLGATMRIEDCLNRRGAVWPSGGCAGKRGGRKGQPKEKQCQGCPVGEAFASCCPGITLRSPSQAPEVMPWSQRMAKMAKALVTPDRDDTGSMNPLHEAAMLSPDDANDWRG